MRPQKVRLDLVGTGLSAAGLGLIVFAILRSGTWGFVKPKPEGPQWIGLSPSIWLILAGGVGDLALRGLGERVIARGGEPLVDPGILRTKVLRSGLTSFFFQYFLQGGLFFAMPLFLSIALGLSAIETGVAPAAALLHPDPRRGGIPKLFPQVSPRLVVRLGFLGMFAALVVLVAGLDSSAGRRGHDLADAARRPGDGSARLPARQRHRLLRAR